MSAQAEQVSLWSAFGARVALTFPFRVDVIVRACERANHPGQAEMGVELHVPDRDTREPITVLTRRPCAPWTDDSAAIEMLFDLLEVALRHETNESVRLDGMLVRDTHVVLG